jgi:hypothetical protein
MANDTVPPCFLDAWARLQVQRPYSVNEDDWRRAIEDGGVFLDARGADAAAWRWSAAELFDIPRDGRLGGLVWFLRGERVQAFAPRHARTDGGRIFNRSDMKGVA